MKKRVCNDSPLSRFGLIGLATMGQNLALNFANKGHSISVYNRTTNVTEDFFSQRAEKFPILPCLTLEDFVQSLERPRRIILMVKAGAPVDETLAQLIPLLSKDDIIIDGGNSFFQDTNRRIISLRLCMATSNSNYSKATPNSITLRSNQNCICTLFMPHMPNYENSAPSA